MNNNQPLKREFDYTLFESIRESLRQTSTLRMRGRVTQVSGTIIKAVMTDVKIGELCILKSPFESSYMMAEVVGFSEKCIYLSPVGETSGISSTTQVFPTGQSLRVPVGQTLLGRILDGLGNPLDGHEKGGLKPEGFYPMHATAPSPLIRKRIRTPIPLGLKALDGLLTCGEGQRMGIFGAAGVGKSVLLASIARNSKADVNVLALIGERGREVREFIENDLGKEGLSRSVVVVATSDRSPIERLKAAYSATAIAEYFRDTGCRVLLMIDSITRFARAQRDIGLAAGEPPTRRGFPPSLFSTLPKLLERAGMSDKGSITGLYTILVEGDDMTEPVADETRSILDGHIILSRKLSAANHYPAIDVQQSISRVMSSIVSKHHLDNAFRVREIISKYKDVELLLKIGEYQKGSDPATDTAIEKIGSVNDFLKQDIAEKFDFEDTLKSLSALIGS